MSELPPIPQSRNVPRPAKASALDPRVSVLFSEGTPVDAPSDQPVFFRDINLDAIVSSIVSGKEEYDLKPYFYAPLKSVVAVAFRQAVMGDVDSPATLRALKAFAKRMHSVREAIAQTGKRRHPQQRKRWFLDTVLMYCDAVTQLRSDLERLTLASQGMVSIREYVSAYARSDHFGALHGEAQALVAQLSSIRYEVHIRGLQVEVRLYAGEPDFGARVVALFDRFNREGAGEYEFDSRKSDDVNNVEGEILRLVAEIYSNEFEKLEEFCTTYAEFLDKPIVRFDREIQFYVAYVEHVARFRSRGLVFCYPDVRDGEKAVIAHGAFDLALAGSLAATDSVPVTNDFSLAGEERILVVTGPNQGGKTTFSRTFAQLHYLAALGCPVPGAAARLFLPDQIFTHFERAEHMTSLTGKLQDDLVRIHEILVRATPRSLIIINEIFASTTLSDAIALSRKIGERIAHLDLLCVWVTFIDEITTLNKKTVSMVSMVDPDNPERRTFKIERRVADGLAYAQSIARKYGLTKKQILARVHP